MTFPYLLTCCPDHGCGHDYPGDLVKCPKCGASDMLARDASLKINPLDYTYDIETFPEIFTCHITHVSSGTKWRFEISPRLNQINEFITFMYQQRDIGARHVGFNNEHFDYPVVHFIVCNPFVTWVEIYNKAMAIIGSRDKFEHSIWERNRIVQQLDLFKMMHYDNVNKFTSLKHLEFNMRMSNIQDLPFPVGSVLTSPQKDTLHNYNIHDVEATTRFYIRTLEHIQLREELTREYGIDMTNYSNTKVGATILTTELEKAGIQCFDRSTGRKQPLQTIHAEIKLGDVTFPYVSFEHPRFAHIKQFIDNKVITQTKGSLHYIDVTDWPADYVCLDKSLWPTSFSVKEDKKTKRLIASNLHVMVDGCLYIFGTGGLHMSIVSKDVRSDDDHQVVDVDVASYYPNLAIKNKMFPAHLGVEFCDIYEGIYIRRGKYKKGSALNKALKEALNASYGNSNNKFSPLFDSFYTMQTTINGQLLLCMLVEQLLKVPGLSMVQCNTDGVTFKTPRKYLDHTRALCRWWEQLTCLELEEALYSRMIIRNVNNYIACYENGDVKHKGAYGFKKDWHQDASALIVPKAAEAALLKGIDVETFIRGHKDPFDFCLKAKVPRASRLLLEWPELGVSAQLGNIIRYVVSTDGGSLVEELPPKGTLGAWKRKNKVPDAVYTQVQNELATCFATLDAMGGVLVEGGITDPTSDGKIIPLDSEMMMHDERIHTKNKSKYEIRRTSKEAGYLITDCSDMDKFDWSSVNYDYYIKEARKIVDPLL